MLRPWKPAFAIDFMAGTPLYQQIAEALIQEIRKGRLKAGNPLPGSRQLAAEIGVNRKTVATAYFELCAQGWLESRPKSGTFVSEKIPENLPQFFTEEKKEQKYPERPHFYFKTSVPNVISETEIPGLITFDDGFPDVRLAPVKPLGIVYRRVMEMKGRRNMMGYSDAPGLPALREKIARMLSETRGLIASPENICISRGSQMGLYLISRVLLKQGDLVAMETLTYTPARDLFENAGATVIPVPIDENGLKTDDLEKMLDRKKIRAIYLTPHHHYPTTVTLRAERRLHLLQLAEQHKFAIIEDDYDHEYHFGFQPVMPLASADYHGSVIYLGSFSKLIAPGLRIGYIVAPSDFIGALGDLRSMIDKHGDPVLEQAVAELIEEGEIKRHTRKAHGEYLKRREIICRLLDKHFGSGAAFTVPQGGLAVWVNFGDSIRSEKMLPEAIKAGVKYTPGSYFSTEGKSINSIRLGYGSKNEKELMEGVERLAKVLKSKG